MNVISLFAHAGHHHAETEVASGAAAAGLAVSLLFFLAVAALAAYALQAYLLSRIFNKAGVEAWKAWVPVYNSWVTLELGGQKGWWAIIAFIPVVSIVALVYMYIAVYHIGLKLRKEGAFVLLAIFIPLVWYAWLAFDSSTWKGKTPAKASRS